MIMKYLGIHKLVWAILVVAFTLFEVALILIGIILYVLWNLQLPSNNVWKEFHTDDGFRTGAAFSDNNIWETIKRRYKGE